ncbi:MAG: DUF45 domain-containing protein [Spirochaetaceae bacterium]|jgi:predicted metal-dependent hydrolase|nr:DUF45 domain-containing protein [Spirochaetaceae bacterium]
MNEDLSLLAGYPENVINQVKDLIKYNKLKLYLQSRYPDLHEIKTNTALFSYIQDIKKTYMKKSSPIHKVTYDDKIETVYNALGLHSFVSRIQGRNLKSSNEIRIASLFKNAPEDLLRMIVVHELAHLKEKDHNKNFYRLCHHMESDYAQLEFDVRLYLISLRIHSER